MTWYITGNNMDPANLDPTKTYFLGTKDNQPLIIKTNQLADNSEKVRVNPDGNVGIGKAPSTNRKLDVAGTINATGIYKNGSSVVSSQWRSVSGGINYDRGNVGIGTATPRSASYKLDVAGTLNADDIHRNGSPLIGSQWTNVSGGISYEGGNVALGNNLKVAGQLRWGNSVANPDSIELGAPDGSTPGGGGTPFIDFHFMDRTEDFNTRIINDENGRLSVFGNLNVTGAINATDYHRDGRVLIAAGRTQPGVGWQQYTNTGLYIDVNTAGYHFTTTPVYVTSLHGNAAHWGTTGGSSVYNPTPTGFRVYIRFWNDQPITVSQVQSFGWHIEWIATEIS